MAALVVAENQAPSPFIMRKLEEGAVYFRLCVMSVDGATVLIDKYPATLKFEELRDQIEERANRHAALGPSIANFLVEAIGENETAMGIEIFRVTGEPVPGLAKTLMSEPANQAGFLAQAMRHSETYMQGMLAMAAQLNGQANASQKAYIENTRLLMERADAGDRARIEALNLMQEIIERRHEREAEQQKAAFAHELKVKAVDKLGNLVPVAIDHMLGKGPEGANAAAILMARTLFQTVRPEQLMKFLDALDGDQRVLAMKLFKNLAEHEEQENTKAH